MDENKIRQIVQEEIKKANQIAQYGVARVPAHTHNNTDAPNLQPHATIGFVSMPAVPNINPGGGVFSPAMLDTQIVNGPPQLTSSANPPAVYEFPIPVVYGYGVGVHSGFNGGTAPQGSLVFFDNGNTISGLWVRTLNGWYRLAADGSAPLP